MSKTNDKNVSQSNLLKFYIVQLGRIWRRIPRSARRLAPARAFGRHIARLVLESSPREQHFATFFLRNRPELELLRRLVAEVPSGARLNLMVIACSKGAEVYSKAWIIRSARPDIDLRINAIDISPKIVRFAERGVYSLIEADDNDQSTEEAVRTHESAESLPSSDKGAWIFSGVAQSEIDSIFEVHDDQAVVRKWLREGITWSVGDATDPELPSHLSPQDIVVANTFLCHMRPPEAEKCLRNLDRFIKPGGHLFVYGVDLDVKEKVARERNWTPVTDLIREIHDGDDTLRSAWPLRYWGIEPLDDRHSDWELRYASVYRIGANQSSDPDSQNTPGVSILEPTSTT